MRVTSVRSKLLHNVSGPIVYKMLHKCAVFVDTVITTHNAALMSDMQAMADNVRNGEYNTHIEGYFATTMAFSSTTVSF